MRLERIAATDHRRHAQFARDDRGVAGAAAAVGDDGGARFMIGSQSGSVMSATSTSPGCTRSSRLIERTTRATCRADLVPMARPSPAPAALAVQRKRSIWVARARDFTVSGRACTM
jgi:hypothetical protein